MGVAGERPSPTAGPPGGVWRGRGLPPEPALTHPAQLPKTPWEHRGEAQNREPEAGKRGRKEIARTRWPLEDPQAGHYWDSGQWPLGLQPETLSGLHLTGSAPQTVLSDLGSWPRSAGQEWRPGPLHALLGQALTPGAFSPSAKWGECSNPCPILGKVRGDEETGRRLLEAPGQTDATGTRPHQPQPHPQGEEEEELPAVLPGLPGQEVLLMPRASCPAPTRFPGASASHPRTKAPGSRHRGRAQPHCPFTASRQKTQPHPRGTCAPKEGPVPKPGNPQAPPTGLSPPAQPVCLEGPAQDTLSLAAGQLLP